MSALENPCRSGWRTLRQSSVVILLALLSPILLAAQPTSLNRLFATSQTRTYQPPSPEELKQAESLFRQAFSGPLLPEQEAAWAVLGFEVLRVTEKNERVFTVIRERRDQRQGRGFYVFSTAPAGVPILQAPHALNDEHTGAIAIGLFVNNPFAAGAWSTAPRRHQTEDGETTTNSDMAHQSDSYFIAFSRAAALARPNSAILQLHGFSTAKRKTAAGRRAGVIVSAGQHESTPALTQTVDCLRDGLNAPVLAYPQEVRELGARTNEIGEMLRTFNRSSFVHIEIAQPLRSQLRADAELRQRIGACLAGVRPRRKLAFAIGSFQYYWPLAPSPALVPIRSTSIWLAAIL